MVLDLGHPDRQAGVILDQLRGAAPGAAPRPAWVAISAMDWDDVLRLYNVPPTSFLPKPFDPSQLVWMLNHMLHQRGMALP